MRAIFAMRISFVAKHNIFHNSTFHDLFKDESIDVWDREKSFVDERQVSKIQNSA